MPKNRDVLEVSTSTVLTSIHNTILCNQSTPITLTLPLPTANGINYKINRNDNVLANTVTLNAGVNLIINGTASSSTFIISPQTYTEITSLDNKWYIYFNVATNTLSVYSLFSTTFVANNTTPFLPLTGNGLVYVAYLPYSARLRTPTLFSICTTWVSNNPTGNFVLEAPAGTPIVSLPVSINSTIPISVFTTSITGFPSGVIPHFAIRWVGNSGSNQKFGFNFFRII
jgi:hypothetical protein